MALIVDHAPLWFAATNTYVVAADSGGPALVIDAPPSLDGIARLLARRDLYPEALLVTHGHIDHVGGAGGFAATSNVATYLHPDDEWLARDPASQLRSIMGMDVPAADVRVFEPPATLERLEDGEVLELAGIELTVLHTPGHTPGHCCFHVASEGILFSGDQLFAGSIGRTDLPGGDFDDLMRSMKDKVLPLADQTAVLPGHGPATTIAAERAHNPFLRGL